MSSATRAVVLAFCIAVALWLVYLLHSALLLIYISAVFAVVLAPAVSAVQAIRIGRWNPGKGAAILLIVAVLALAIVIFLAFAIPPIIRDIQQLARDLPQKLESWQARLQTLPFSPGITAADLQQYVGSFLASAASIIKGTFTLLSSIITVLLLTAYLILDGERVFNRTMLLLPAGTRASLEPALRRSARVMRKWLVGQAFLMLILGSSSAVAFGLLKLRYFYVLAVLAGILNIIPMLGPVITVILASLVAAIDSMTKLLGVLVFYFIYQQVENAFLTPRIMQAQVEISGTAVIVALLLGAELAGAAGALVAVPSAVLILGLIDYYVVEPRAGPTEMP